MNTSRQSCHKRSFKPLVLALALALPGSVAVAAAIGDSVNTRADQNIDQQYGRDSVYAFSPESKPLSPERTSGPHWFHKSGQKDAALNDPQRGELGSGYTDSEVMSNGAMPSDESPSNAGSGYTDSEVMSEAGSGYTESEDEIVSQADTADGTTNEFDRGYYKDPGETPILVIISDNSSMEGDQSASVEERGWSIVPD